MAINVLVVEDDVLLADGICEGLKQYGYCVDHERDGLSAQHALMTRQYDVAVMDVGLPGKSGFEVLSAVKRQHIVTPIILLTALDQVQSKIEGLDRGADDYIVKPFDLEELCARIRVQVRSKSEQIDPVLVNGSVTLDPSTYKVSINGDEVVISRREFALLHKLMEQIGRVITRDVLMETLYGWGEEVESNTIEVHVHNLRKKLGDAMKIRTIRGVGYAVEKSA